jgi:hypothetical protein
MKRSETHPMRVIRAHVSFSSASKVEASCLQPYTATCGDRVVVMVVVMVGRGWW